MPADIGLGEYELRGRDQFVSVQEYETLEAGRARFESHERYVDLQYTIEGAEQIDWIPRSELSPDGSFANDVQFWLPPSGALTSIVQSTGRFSIFYPEDAHRPKVHVPGIHRVKKLVVKTLHELVK